MLSQIASKTVLQFIRKDIMAMDESKKMPMSA